MSFRKLYHFPGRRMRSRKLRTTMRASPATSVLRAALPRGIVVRAGAGRRREVIAEVRVEAGEGEAKGEGKDRAVDFATDDASYRRLFPRTSGDRRGQPRDTRSGCGSGGSRAGRLAVCRRQGPLLRQRRELEPGESHGR